MNSKEGSLSPLEANTTLPRYKTRAIAPIKCGPIFNSPQTSSEFGQGQEEEKLSDFGHELNENCSSQSSSPRKKSGLNSPSKKGPKVEKTYTCDVCSQIFTQISNLKRHERLHTGERPYKCERCSKTFSTHSNLKQHQQVHENTSARMRFDCEICQRTYFYQSSLNKHTKSHEKVESGGEIDKDCKSLSPTKGQPKSAIFNEMSTNWDDSLPSDDSQSDISPTTKKLKKGNSTTNQVGSMTTINTAPSSTTATPTITAQNCEYPAKEGLDEVFMSGFQRNLAKVMSTTSYNFDLAKSILDLQYLTISGNPYGITNTPIFNAANKTTSTPTQTLPKINPLVSPNDRFKVFNNQITLNFNTSATQAVEQRQQQPVNNYSQPFQSLKMEEQKPITNDCHEDTLLSFKSKRFSLELGQQSSALESFPFNSAHHHSNIEAPQERSGMYQENNNKQIEDPLFKKMEVFPFANDMVDDRFDNFWDRKERKMSNGSHYGGFLSDIFLYQNFPKETHDFLAKDIQEREVEDFFS